MARDAREYVVYNGHLQRVRSTRSIHKPFDEMSTLRKLTSLKYLSHKVRGWLHKDSRDTMASAADEDENFGASVREIICCEEELMVEPAKPAFHCDDRRSSITTTRTSDSETSLFSSFLNDESSFYEPTKDQRWCLNCHKCFQRQLSHFDHYCGLDCKTAHRVRMST